MNARLYDPALGRFLSPDPYVQMPDFTQNFNRYSYCLNNPLRYVDKDGEIVWFVPVLIGVGVYALIEYGSQVVTNYMEKRTNPNCNYTTADILFNKIDWFDIAVEGVAGGLSVAFPAAATWIKYLSPVVENAVDLNFDGSSRVVFKDFGFGDYLMNTGLDVATTAMTDVVNWGITKKNPYSFDKSTPFQNKSLFERYDDVSMKDIMDKTFKDMPWDFGSSIIGNTAKQGWKSQYDEWKQQNQPYIPTYNPEFPYYYRKNTRPNDNSDNNEQFASQLSKYLQLNLLR